LIPQGPTGKNDPEDEVEEDEDGATIMLELMIASRLQQDLEEDVKDDDMKE
jgi:hypothetical protein